jgi:hypothetical protein
MGMAKSILVIGYAFVTGNRNQAVSITFSSDVGYRFASRKRVGMAIQDRKTAAYALAARKSASLAKIPTRALKAENACVGSTQAFSRA